MSFRYYLYISDAKVDMLLPQIDSGFTRKQSTELSLSLKLVSAKRSVEGTGSDRIARLERVVRHLEEHGDLGTVDEPGQYFWGLLPMQWGLVSATDSGSLLYFGGRTEQTTLCLGGSGHHLLGTVVAVEQRQLVPQSLLPVLLSGLAAGEADEESEEDGSEPLDRADRAALALVHQANRRLRGPAQNMEFVAKRLLHGPSPYPELDGRDDATVLLGSPLYVAQVD